MATTGEAKRRGRAERFDHLFGEGDGIAIGEWHFEASGHRPQHRGKGKVVVYQDGKRQPTPPPPRATIVIAA